MIVKRPLEESPSLAKSERAVKRKSSPGGQPPGTRRRGNLREDLILSADRILETLGPQAATVRTITAHADTNSSAVNYYFQSRENLLAEVGRRRMDVHNERMSDRLAEIESAHGAITVAEVFRPLVETAFEIWASDPVLKSLRKMTVVEPLVIETFAAYEINQIYGRMLSYLTRACPHFTLLDIEWRFRVSFGAMMYQLMVRDVQPQPILAKEISVERMVRYIAAAFAPTPGTVTDGGRKPGDPG